MDEESDPLGPARGCLVAGLIGIAVWSVAGAILWVLLTLDAG